MVGPLTTFIVVAVPNTSFGFRGRRRHVTADTGTTVAVCRSISCCACPVGNSVPALAQIGRERKKLAFAGIDRRKQLEILRHASQDSLLRLFAEFDFDEPGPWRLPA